MLLIGAAACGIAFWRGTEEKEITEENIQSEIESVAIRWGMEIEWSFKKEEWEIYATSSAMCKIFIPE